MSVKKVLVTHGNCPDGAAAAVIAKRIDPDIKIVFGQHKEINDQVMASVNEVEDGGVVTIADICCDEDVLIEAGKALMGKQGVLNVFEHHESRKWLRSFELPAELKGEVVFDDQRSGGKIFYDAMTESEGFSWTEDYQEFIRLTNDRDLWLNQDERSKELAKLHFILGDEGYIQRFVENPDIGFTKEEKLLLDYQKREEDRAIEKAMGRIQLAKDGEGFDYGVIYGEGSGSDILNQAIVQFDLEYAILVNLHSKKASIRSRGKFDCTKYAEKYGGGGHVRASGFRFDFTPPHF